MSHLNTRPLIIHMTNHKTGNMLFNRILWTFCHHAKLRFFTGKQKDLDSNSVDVWLEPNSNVDLGALERSFIGSHSVRDPRSIVVSGYDYHCTTKEEAWLEETGYQAQLNSLPESEGLMLEIEKITPITIKSMLRMQKIIAGDPRFLTVRYEDMVADFDNTIRRLFQHYGICKDDSEIEKYLPPLQKYAPKRADHPHVTNKEQDLQRWKKRLSIAHLRRIDELFPNACSTLGYPPTDWEEIVSFQ